MVAIKGNLVNRMSGFIARKPFFFKDILEHFAEEGYRDLLVAWSEIRSKEKFDRDEDGRYILVKRGRAKSRKEA